MPPTLSGEDEAIFWFFTHGTLVLRNTKEVHRDLPRPKFTPSWEGPSIIHKDVGNGCYDRTIVEGDDVLPVNAKFLKLWCDPIEGGYSFE